MPFAEITEVYVALEAVEAAAVAGLLEAAGLSPRIRDMTITPYPVAFGPLGEKRVAVPTTQARQARELLRHAVNDGYLLPQGIILEDPAGPQP